MRKWKNSEVHLLLENHCNAAVTCTARARHTVNIIYKYVYYSRRIMSLNVCYARVRYIEGRKIGEKSYFQTRGVHDSYYYTRVAAWCFAINFQRSNIRILYNNICIYELTR